VYDAAGQLTHTISALGEVSESKYDAVGRPVYSRRYFNRLSAGTVAAFGDAIAKLIPPTATANDQLNYVVYDHDGRARFTLKATGSSGWAISENRYDANGNVIEVRRYDKFLPNARAAAIDSVNSPGITLPEIQIELSTTLGYSDNVPTTLASGSLVDEEWLIRLERRLFVELLKTPETQARIKHMLETGKPLRN
jgi:YD repeat-containing protein